MNQQTDKLVETRQWYKESLARRVIKSLEWESNNSRMTIDINSALPSFKGEGDIEGEVGE